MLIHRNVTAYPIPFFFLNIEYFKYHNVELKTVLATRRENVRHAEDIVQKVECTSIIKLFDYLNLSFQY
jgi:hypothetical protein